MKPEELSEQPRDSEDPKLVRKNTSQYVEKKKFTAKIKMNNGKIYRGNIHIRPSSSRVKDELNAIDEKYIAITDVTDRNGKTIPFPALIAINNIAYIGVDDSLREEENISGEMARTIRQNIPKRKLTAYIDFPDGSRIRGGIFIRYFLNRAKDELNIRSEVKFIVVSDVVEPHAADEDARLTYFVNSEQVICIIPINEKSDR